MKVAASPTASNWPSDSSSSSKGMAPAQVNVFEAGKAPGADHEKRDGDDQSAPGDGEPPPGDRLATGEMHHRRHHASAAGNGHADKIFSSWPARIRWLRILGDVEAGQAAGASGEKNKAGDDAELHQLHAQITT